MNENIISGYLIIIKQKVHFIYRIFIAIPFLIFFRILNFFNIEIRMYPYLFGHQVAEIEYLLRKFKISKIHKVMLIFIQRSVVPNKYLLEKHKNYVKVFNFSKLAINYIFNAQFVNYKYLNWNTMPTVNLESMMTDYDIWNNSEPEIIFNEEEIELGERILRKLELVSGNYICFHSRESSYAIEHLAKVMLVKNEKKGMTIGEAKHAVQKLENRLNQKYRYSSPNRYIKALKYLNSKGIKSVRVGAKASENLIENVPGFVDYAASIRSELSGLAEFADIYIMAKCKFYIGTSTGLSFLAYIFNKPIVSVNNFPWPWHNMPPQHDALYMPKKVFNKKLDKIMSFDEMIEFSRMHNVREFYDDNFMLEHGFEPIENTEDEIYEIALEMNEKLDGTWVDNAEMLALQKIINDKFTDDTLMYKCPSKMGGKFLLDNSNLM